MSSWPSGDQGLVDRIPRESLLQGSCCELQLVDLKTLRERPEGLGKNSRRGRRLHTRTAPPSCVARPIYTDPTGEFQDVDATKPAPTQQDAPRAELRTGYGVWRRRSVACGRYRRRPSNRAYPLIGASRSASSARSRRGTRRRSSACGSVAPAHWPWAMPSCLKPDPRRRSKWGYLFAEAASEAGHPEGVMKIVLAGTGDRRISGHRSKRRPRLVSPARPR